MFTLGKSLNRRTFVAVSATAAICAAHYTKSSTLCSDMSTNKLDSKTAFILADSLTEAVPKAFDGVGTEKDYISRPSFEKTILKVSKNVMEGKRPGVYTILVGPKGSGKSAVVARVLSGKRGVVHIAINEKDTPYTVVLKLYQQIGLKYDPALRTTIDHFPSVLQKVADDREGLPITIVLEMESCGPQALRLVKLTAAKFASNANVIVILSDMNAASAFREDNKQQFIWVDEMTRTEAVDYAKRLHPAVSDADLNLILEKTGQLPSNIKTSMQSLRKGLKAAFIVDEAVDVALDDLYAFVHRPILAALKGSPDGVNAARFAGVQFKGVNLGDPQHVAMTSKDSAAVLYHLPSGEYRPASRAHRKALEIYKPQIVIDINA
jgi:hypothetical protein